MSGREKIRIFKNLKEFPRYIVFLGLISSVLIMSVICFVIAVKWVDKPFPGFLLNERMVIGNIGQYHWAGTQAGLKFPDKILAANNKVISSMGDLENVVQNTRIGDPIRYSVDRDGKIIEVTIPAMRFTVADLLMTFGIPFLSGIIYLFIAVVVFILK